MIKCDENFSKELFPEFKNSINIETISPNSIVGKSKDFIEKEIESYYEQFGKEKPSKQCCSNNCKKMKVVSNPYNR